jgi:hypothetical protein
VNGINAKAPRRREWWPSAKTFAPSRLCVFALNFYAAPDGAGFNFGLETPNMPRRTALGNVECADRSAHGRAVTCHRTPKAFRKDQGTPLLPQKSKPRLTTACRYRKVFLNP